MEKRACTELPFMQYKLFVSRTGYTGEDGFEIVDVGRSRTRDLAAARSPRASSRAASARATRCGSKRRCRSGATTSTRRRTRTRPASAGSSASTTARSSPAATRSRASRPPASTRKLACLKATDRGVIRDDYPILHGGELVGTVASGGFSPTLGTSIAMAYLPLELAQYGTELDVDVRGRLLPVGRRAPPVRSDEQRNAVAP